jgi:hypothetical protein
MVMKSDPMVMMLVAVMMKKPSKSLSSEWR